MGVKLHKYSYKKSHLVGDISVRYYGGAKGDRTPDLLTASQALSQLSYGPMNV